MKSSSDWLISNLRAEGVYNVCSPNPLPNKEMMIKSRRVIPSRLLSEGYEFEFSEFEEAIKDLKKHE